MSKTHGQHRSRSGCFQYQRSVNWYRLVLATLLLALSALTACAPLGSAEQAGQSANQVTRLPTDAEVEQYNAQVPPEERIICRNEVPVGSNIPRRTCRFIKDIEETSRFTRDQLRNVLQ